MKLTQILYALTASLAIVTGLVHSVLGERLIFRHLRENAIVPSLAAPPLQVRHVRILWATWHLASVFNWACAAILLCAVGSATAPAPIVVDAIGVAYLGCAALVFVGTRGRHPGWIALLLVAVLTWFAANAGS